MRLSSNGKLVERVTIKIKIFDTGKWDWTVRQRFVKEPRIRVDDILSILDEIKKEILIAEGRLDQNGHPIGSTTTTQQQGSEQQQNPASQ